MLDAGVVVAALAEGGGRGAAARERMRQGSEHHAPHLLDLEACSALRGLVQGRRLTAAAAHGARCDVEVLRG